MTTGVSGFDDRLNQVLEQQAGKADETVAAYVRRAVVTQLVKDLKLDTDSDLGALIRKLEDAEIDVPPAASDPSPTSPISDPNRLEALEKTGLMDSPPDENYDRIVAMAADALAAPSAAVSLIGKDRQFFKSALGLPDALDGVREIPVDSGICRYAVEAGEPLIIEDARLDEKLKDHPAVLDGSFVAYAGIPLTDDGGHSIGTLCVWDKEPRQWTTGHVQVLQDLAWMVRERIFG